jgi:hypothetical protein
MVHLHHIYEKLHPDGRTELAISTAGASAPMPVSGQEVAERVCDCGFAGASATRRLRRVGLKDRRISFGGLRAGQIVPVITVPAAAPTLGARRPP